MGRPRKTSEQLQRSGAFRQDRHGRLSRAPKFGGEPVKPRGLSPEAARHWDLVVPDLVKSDVAKAADAPALEALCEQWAAYRAAMKERARTFNEKRQKQMLINAALRAWRDLASRFGLTPGDRAKLEISDDGEKQGEFAKLLGGPAAQAPSKR